MHPIDKKDLIIIDELLKDSRTSYSDLAKKLKLSVPAIISRIEKLKTIGIIQNFTLKIDSKKISDGSPDIILVKCPKKSAMSLIEHFSRDPAIRKIFQVTGSYELVLLTHFLVEKEKSAFVKRVQNAEQIDDFDILDIQDEYMSDYSLVQVGHSNSIKLVCDYCKREFSGDVFSKVIGPRKRYFCCNTCLSQFEVKFEKSSSN
ncbi:MAG: AsnC family transcriptional regulator [Candidatus Heimdallarchaeota archaeon]|nr:AsnC family transcriptional regulator [Candidatus Heimdallarchaeota archaeon]